MELRQLRYFVAVAESLHFGQAAEALHLAQPALSRAVRQLEQELRTPLLIRSTRRVALTPAGRGFLDDARAILRAADESVERARLTAKGERGPLRLGVTGSASYGVLPTVARIVTEELPGVTLQVETEMLTPVQVQALLEARLDAGLLRPPVPDDRLAYRTLAREHLVLALPSDHQLASRDDVTITDLRTEPFILYAAATGSVVREAVLRTCQEAGFTPRHGHDVEDTSTLLALVAAGLGIALVPQSARAMALAGVRFADLEGSATVDLALAWRRDDAPPVVAQLVEALERRDLFPIPAMLEV